MLARRRDMTTEPERTNERKARLASEALRRLAEDPRGRELLFGRHEAGEELRREIAEGRRSGKGRDDACEASPRRSSR